MPFAFDHQAVLAVGLCLAAVLYTSVGHGGASAYLAIMALAGVAAATMRPTALVLNVIASSFAAAGYIRAGQFRWRTLWPVLAGAVPMAFLGGSVQLPGHYYRPLVGIVLLVSAARLLWPGATPPPGDIKDPPLALSLASGAGIGLLSGLTGTGGGIFLSPLLIFLGWCDPRTASGVAAVFILCNSIAGLLGNLIVVRALPSELAIYAGAVLIGAMVGTQVGIRISSRLILKALGVVLAIAGLKLIGMY